jgi:hypothetical protein
VNDLTAVLPLVLVAGVFVTVCIVALRATDWRAREDRTIGTAGRHSRAAAADASDASDSDHLSDATAPTDDEEPPGSDPVIR